MARMFFCLICFTLVFAQTREEEYRKKQEENLERYNQRINEQIDRRNAAVEEYRRKERQAIEKYQKRLNLALGRDYLYEKDTSALKSLVSTAIMDDIEPQNLANAAKVLESGIEKGVKVEDAIDIAQLVSSENIKVSEKQTAAFSEARQIAKENNADIGKTDEMLYNAIRKGQSAPDLIAMVKNYVAKQKTTAKKPPQTFSEILWEDKMKNKIQEFFIAKTPYVWGGNSINGVDCSGFTSICFSEIGMDIPRHSGEQFRKGVKINPENAKFGDLIFFYSDSRKGRIGHVGIVSEITSDREIRFVHSSRGKKGIGYDVLSDASYWGKHFAGIKRVANSSQNSSQFSVLER